MMSDVRSKYENNVSVPQLIKNENIAIVSFNLLKGLHNPFHHLKFIPSTLHLVQQL